MHGIRSRKYLKGVIIKDDDNDDDDDGYDDHEDVINSSNFEAITSRFWRVDTKAPKLTKKILFK